MVHGEAVPGPALAAPLPVMGEDLVTQPGRDVPRSLLRRGERGRQAQYTRLHQRRLHEQPDHDEWEFIRRV